MVVDVKFSKILTVVENSNSFIGNKYFVAVLEVRGSLCSCWKTVC